MTPISLPSVTMIVVDTLNYGEAVSAIQKSLKQITPARTIWFTDIETEVPGVEIIQIPHIYSKKEYSDWMMKELGNQPITTTHILVIQADGYVLDGSCWEDEFMKYDYVGAPWLEQDGYNVGNGGMSLRSFHLHKALADDPIIKGIQPEDVGICRIYRDYLVQKYNITFAPDDLAHRFSYELHEPKQPTFGFHGKFHPPYVEPICIKRTGALGDVVQVEPILEYFHSKGHPVYLDTLPQYYHLFSNHYFKVGNYARFDKTVIKHRIINLDLAYEVNPQQLHLKTYFEMAGIKDYALRNPKLNYPIGPHNKMFKKYVVVHIDDRDTPYRNVFGVKWKHVEVWLEAKGYTVIQIGAANGAKIGHHFNTVNELVMNWLIAGCDFFIGVDSGPAQVAVALDKKCLLFFGSVNPEFIHYDRSKIKIMHTPCPIDKEWCWHSEPGTKGVDCEADRQEPPCCVHDTERVLETLNELI